MEKVLVKSGKPRMDGLLVVQEGKIFVYADFLPRDYKWQLDDGTAEEKDYLLRCMIENRWLNH
jgi:hypothetical protein